MLRVGLAAYSGEMIVRPICTIMKWIKWKSTVVLLALTASALVNVTTVRAEPAIEIWHGDEQRVGHLGDAQDDFNVLGHVKPWSEVHSLMYSVNGGDWKPLSFRAVRRLEYNGDFNADIPIATLRPGANTVTVRARFLDGGTLERKVTVTKAPSGRSPLPVKIDWRKVTDPQEVGQYVDGKWELTPDGLHTSRIGYDRLFLIGDRSWKDYEVSASVTIHDIYRQQPPRSSGVGLVLRFAGHVIGGPREFPPAQPKWGYQPFGAIGWLRWLGTNPDAAPYAQYFPGVSDKWVNFKQVEFQPDTTYKMRMTCDTLPDDPTGQGVTSYRYKVWAASNSEPSEWSWELTQVSESALRQGGVALLAHYVDATFHDVTVVGR